jgi:thiamine kinase-like enzyme
VARHNPTVDVQPLVERVWPGRPATVSPLGGGITNHNFLVLVDDEAFVLRIGGKDTELLGIDRRAEEDAARMAASIGVGPEVAAIIRPEGYLVTRFIEGQPVPPERMREPHTLERLASSLVAIHSGPPIRGKFNAHRIVEAYATTAAEHGVPIPPRYAWAKGISDLIESARGPQPEVSCHNDLLNANFIDDGERIRIVDWEYAGMGDRFFDLGNLSIKHEFDPDDDRRLLSAYFGETRGQDLSAVRLMRFMGAFFEAMWGVVQQGISELDFDFRAYSEENFERLRRIEEDAEFETWIAACSG